MDVGVNIEIGTEVFRLLDAVDELMGLVEVEHVNAAYLLRDEINNILAELVVVD